METLINVAELTNRGQKVGRKRGLWLIFLRSCFIYLLTYLLTELSPS
jgi:hypothetical protein